MASHGLKALVIKAAGKVAGLRKAPVSYDKWLPKHLPTAAQLARQKETTFDYMPRISIVVPLYRTPPGYLSQLIQSVKDQTYGNWELCLSDGSGADSPLKSMLERYQKEDERIKVIFHEESLKIAENTNAAIEAADVVFMTSEMSAIPQAIDIARATKRISWQNVYFALIIKFVVMIVGLFGFANMWVAVFADTGVSLLCLLNSVRILRRK